MSTHETTAAIEAYYQTLGQRCDAGRAHFGRALTLTEKILIGHHDAWHKTSSGKLPSLTRRQTSASLRPDRVAMQDATAQMALLQFMVAERAQVAAPTTVHCDHLIQAHTGAQNDLLRALDENSEVYAFLKSASAKYGIGFWEPGAGIIHQVVLENYAFPGGMMIGTDSHTPNAGGLGMVAVGVGGADAVDVMLGLPFGVQWPGVIGVELSGKLSGWAAPKDIILKLMEILTVKGGTGHIVEFFGEGAASLSCTGKATICNMGAEHGATTSVFPYDASMAAYLRQTCRDDIATLADAHAANLAADPEVLAEPEKFYDRVVRIDLDALQPYVVGPHSPDAARPISAMAQEAKEKDFPTSLRYALIGSCTNSSYEDIGRAAHVAKQALDAGLKTKIPLMVTPGSEKVFATIKRDGQMEILEKAGATVLANACGPCIGQWKRDDIAPGETNAIVSSYNRNFRGRNDGNPETLSFIGSPELVTAMAFSGKLDFDPQSDSIGDFQFAPPTANALPGDGFVQNTKGFVAATKGGDVDVIIDPKSPRIEALRRFAPWDGDDLKDLTILLKAVGKCTTDHISAAGPWLRFRGHLTHISDNMFLGANNAFAKKPGFGLNTQKAGADETLPLPKLAQSYRDNGIGWVAIGDENYGEGSSREHAAMSPRLLGAKAVLVRSFARIHETNLKKQGVLPLTFADPADYDRIQAMDKLSVLGLQSLAPGKPLSVVLVHEDGSQDQFEAHHTLTPLQIDWFKAGSALNHISKAA